MKRALSELKARPYAAPQVFRFTHLFRLPRRCLVSRIALPLYEVQTFALCVDAPFEHGLDDVGILFLATRRAPTPCRDRCTMQGDERRLRRALSRHQSDASSARTPGG
jgi:hypothetical protein